MVIMPYSRVQTFRAHYTPIRFYQYFQHSKLPSTEPQAASIDRDDTRMKIRLECSAMEYRIAT